MDDNFIGRAIRRLLYERHMTQAEFAEQLHVSPSAVQKWLKEENYNVPPTLRIIDICKLFKVGYEQILGDLELARNYEKLERSFLPRGSAVHPRRQDTEIIVYEAGLAMGAKLHRFKNRVGAECSAIYIEDFEILWHYRDREADMIRYWNEEFHYSSLGDLLPVS